MSRIPNEYFFQKVEQYLNSGLPVRFRVKGTSMTPLLRNGKEEVIVYLCGTATLRRWDVVLFRYRGNYVLHRIVDCSADRYIMQGDGVWASYEVCSRDDILGVVRQVIAPSGRVISTSSFAWCLKSAVWRRLGCFLRYLNAVE